MMESDRWWAKGLLFENCSCQLLCRAHVSFKQRCDGDVCVGHWAAHIVEGRFGGVSIDDLNVAVIYEAPPLMYAGDWKQRLYIDERADTAQRAALESILTGRAGGPWATLGQFVVTKLESRFTAVTFKDAGHEKRMTIPGVFDTTVTAIRSRDGADHAVISNLYNVIHGLVHVLARGTTRCRDEAFDFTTDKTHALYSEFSWDRESTGV